MANQHMKQCSTTWDINTMLIKTKIRYGQNNVTIVTTPDACKDLEKLNL